MGQKVHPIGFRLGIIRDWDAKWFATGKNYATNLVADQKVRRFLRDRLSNAEVSRIELLRAGTSLNVTLHTGRPGIVIGKKGEDIERLRRALMAMNGGPVQVSVEEIRKPELDARLVAASITQQLERRVLFRRAMKRAVTNTMRLGIMFRRAMRRAVQNAMRLGAQGVKVMVAGRLNGAEIARTEWYREGRVPLHTLRADVDYGFAEAHTTYGVIGVKVWIFNGEIMPADEQEETETPTAAA